MLDLIYVLATVGFFALMLAYVRGCEALGRGEDFPETEPAPGGATPGARP